MMLYVVSILSYFVRQLTIRHRRPPLRSQVKAYSVCRHPTVESRWPIPKFVDSPEFSLHSLNHQCYRTFRSRTSYELSSSISNPSSTLHTRLEESPSEQRKLMRSPSSSRSLATWWRSGHLSLGTMRRMRTSRGARESWNRVDNNLGAISRNAFPSSLFATAVIVRL